MFMFFARRACSRRIGGVLAAMFFRKDVPPALGGTVAAAARRPNAALPDVTHLESPPR